MALPSSKPAGSDSPPKHDHHQRGTPQEGELAATFMLIAYAAAKRGPPVGRIRTAAIPGGAPRADPAALRRETPCLCLARRSAHRPLPRRRGLLRYTYGLRQTRRLSPRGRGHHSRMTAALVRSGGVAGTHPVAAGPHARFVSLCARPGRPRCAPSALALRASPTPFAARRGPCEVPKHYLIPVLN